MGTIVVHDRMIFIFINLFYTILIYTYNLITLIGNE